MRHDGDIAVFVAGVLNNAPAEMRKKVLSTGREEIYGEVAARCCFAKDVVGKDATDAAPPISRSDAGSG